MDRGDEVPDHADNVSGDRLHVRLLATMTRDNFNVAPHGCYIVDTVTGELWRAAADGQPKKISEKLR